MGRPPLKFLHADDALLELKLTHFRRMSSDDLIESLAPDKVASLKAKADGTVMDGHHRIRVLQERGVAVDDLPREIWQRIE